MVVVEALVGIGQDILQVIQYPETICLVGHIILAILLQSLGLKV